VVRAVGANKESAVDVRIVAATHRDLRRRVTEGAFREDLLYRLEVVTLDMPPLRHRRDDIPTLIEHFFAQAKARHPRSVAERFSPEAMARLLDHPWPGNVRELEHVVERVVLLGRAREVTVGDLPPTMGAKAESLPAFGSTVVPLRDVQRRYVAWAYEQLGGRKLLTAEKLGVDVKTLSRWLRADDDTSKEE
jgi:two-component system response regulator HydG